MLRQSPKSEVKKKDTYTDKLRNELVDPQKRWCIGKGGFTYRGHFNHTPFQRQFYNTRQYTDKRPVVETRHICAHWQYG